MMKASIRSKTGRKFAQHSQARGTDSTAKPPSLDRNRSDVIDRKSQGPENAATESNYGRPGWVSGSVTGGVNSTPAS
jgi:hypothetical protein